MSVRNEVGILTLAASELQFSFQHKASELPPLPPFLGLVAFDFSPKLTNDFAEAETAPCSLFLS